MSIVMGGMMGGVSDPFAAQVKMLMKVSGSSFIDASPNAYTLTPSANVVVSTDAPFSGEKSFGVSSGNTGKIAVVTNGTNFNTGTGDFTVESWAKLPLNHPSGETVVFGRVWSGNIYLSIVVLNNGTIYGWVGHASSGWFRLISSAGAFPANTWRHVAVVRDGNVFSLYLNAARLATTTNAINLTNSNTANVQIGGWSHDPFGQNNGLLYDTRVTFAALYSGSSYLVPSSPF